MGNWRSNDDEIKNIVINFYEGLFTSASPPCDVIEEVASSSTSLFSCAEINHLNMPFTEYEVKEALFSM